MPRVYVCPLSRIAETVAKSNASHLVSLINDGTPVMRPQSIPEANHLFLGINDIVDPMDGMVLPGHNHVEQLIAFVGGWEADRPIVVHCFAGISRSTAAAFITLCALKPERDEADIARRMRAASRHALPNSRLVAVGDDILGRNGRMVDAVREMGRGEFTPENTPFSLALHG
ncbi:MAG: tyrosine phosphatase family protein [Bauldia sp.]|nr:tyrosine phosphatase family protein [Bauldia sp.]